MKLDSLQLSAVAGAARCDDSLHGCAQVCFERRAKQAVPDEWAGSAAALRESKSADLAESGELCQDVVMFVGSQGALLGSVEVRRLPKSRRL